MNNKKNTIISVVSLLFFILLIGIMIKDLFPLIDEIIKDKSDEAKMLHYMDAYGAKGVPILIGLQILQIVLVIIPAQPIQILIGLCYGIWVGTLIGVTGGIIGNALVLFLIKQFKYVFAPLFQRKTKKNHNEFIESIQHMEKPMIIVMVLYFIPVIPNGILPYIFSNSKITYPKFMMGVAIGLTPQLILLTLVGDALSRGNYKVAIVIGVLVVLLLSMVFIFKKKILNKLKHTLS